MPGTSTTDDAPDDRLVVGRVGRAHGIKGQVSVDVRTDDPDRRYAPGSVLETDRGAPLTVAASQWHSGRLLVAFEGVPDRTAAEALRGTLLLVDPASAPPTDDPDEYWDHQLVGLRAEHAADGRALGTVEEVLHPPGGDLLVLRTAEGRELLVPFVAAIVPVVEPDAGRLVVDPPEGLLELGEPGTP